MAHQPQQAEVGVELAGQHGFQVELDVGGARQAGVVAQDPQPQAVAGEPPQAIGGAVEVLLHQAVGAAFGDGVAAVQVLSEADQVDRRLFPGVADGVVNAARGQLALERQPAVAQLLEQDQQPALPRQRDAGVARGQAAPLLIEALPHAETAVPRAVDRLVEPLAGRQMIVGRGQAVQRAAVGDALQQVRRQDRALGLDGGEGGAG